MLLDGRDLAALPRREVARQIALVAQDPPADVPFTVLELVLMGRAPHLKRLALESPRDKEVGVSLQPGLRRFRLHCDQPGCSP